MRSTVVVHEWIISRRLAVLELFTFLPHEWQGPCEYVHEVWEPVGVGTAVELANVHYIILVLQHCSLQKKGQKQNIRNNLEPIGGNLSEIVCHEMTWLQMTLFTFGNLD